MSAIDATPNERTRTHRLHSAEMERTNIENRTDRVTCFYAFWALVSSGAALQKKIGETQPEIESPNEILQKWFNKDKNNKQNRLSTIRRGKVAENMAINTK